jgi:peptidoglycan/LPS O-acetylase OafA/YrhL
MEWRIWRSLRRVTSSGRYIPEIDGLRFVAIVSVLFYHLGMMSIMGCGFCIPFPPTTMGVGAVFHMDRGVPIFFAISGLVLGLPFAEQYISGGRKVRLRSYFLRRITRLEPPYIVNLLLRFPLLVALKHVPVQVALSHLLASLVYLHWLIYGAYPLIHPASWSLEIEVQFYILAPLLALLFFARRVWLRRFGLLAAIIAFGVIRAHTPQFQLSRWNLSLGCSVQYFLAGLLMADGFLTILPRLKSSWMWDVFGIPLWCSVFFISETAAGFFMPLMLFVMFASAFRGTLLNRFFRNVFVATVGGMCYSIYLTHSLVLQGCYAVFAKLHLLSGYYGAYVAGVLVGLPLILLSGTIFYVLVERPCMDRDWPQKLSRYVKGRLPVRVAS